MAEFQDKDSNANRLSFELKFGERGKNSPKSYFTKEHYKNQIRGIKGAGIGLNQEVRENLKEISRKFGGIIAEKEEVARKSADASKTDYLTKIPNKGGFDEALKTKMEESKRFGFPLTLISMDMDNFKILNDTLGHLEGDKVLVSTARTLQSIKRKIDICARDGGDEFKLILPSANQENAKLVVEKVLNKFKENVSDRFPEFKLGLSCGIYQWNGEESFESFLKNADDKLYEMKRQRHAEEEKEKHG